MTVYIFTGPTISPREARTELDAIYLPPVSQGDVYRATLERPRAIGIIDGYFECVPAVWHKEILWAMHEGIHVFGSASMGALRAAELAAFGMEGVGKIFEAYRDGIIEDDDEVAVAHGQAETGYRPLSVAMVNIRFTLAAAQSAGAIDVATRAGLEHIGKSLFYPERTYRRILVDAASEGLPDGQLHAFRDWLPAGEVNQKRDDALAMLRLMRDRLTNGLERKSVIYSLQYTDMWDHARRHAGEFARGGDAAGSSVGLTRVLEELRLEGDRYRDAYQAATVRSLALEKALRRGIAVTQNSLDVALDRFCRERGLAHPQELDRWREDQHLDRDGFNRLIVEEAQLCLVQAGGEREVMSRLADHLRLTGEYGRLLARARDKQQVLESSGMENPAVGDSGLTEEELLRWYFETRLGRPVVSDVRAYARSLGFEDVAAFRRTVLREYLYSSRKG